MQPPARSAEAWRVFSLVQASCSQTVDESMGEKQQKEKISHWMNGTVKTTEGRLMTHATRVYATDTDSHDG